VSNHTLKYLILAVAISVALLSIGIDSESITTNEADSSPMLVETNVEPVTESVMTVSAITGGSGPPAAGLWNLTF